MSYSSTSHCFVQAPQIIQENCKHNIVSPFGVWDMILAAVAGSFVATWKSAPFIFAILQEYVFPLSTVIKRCRDFKFTAGILSTII